MSQTIIQDPSSDVPDRDNLEQNSGGGRKRRLSGTFEVHQVSRSESESEDDMFPSRRESLLASTQDAQLLTSVQNLRQRIERRRSRALEKLFRNHTFVGVVNRQYSLIQYRTKLYLVRHRDVAFHLFYEKVLQQFGGFSTFQLPVPLSVYELLYEALGNPRSGYDAEDGPRDQLADEMKELLASNGQMLAEYFSIDIDSTGMLRTLPRLLGDHEPSIHSLPEFVFHLATEVQWDEEEPCFDNVAHVLAQWYSELWYPSHPERGALILEHVVFPATKATADANSAPRNLLPYSPPDELNDTTVLRPIACLTQLYRIFERC